MNKAHIGSSFESFLEEEGLLEDVNARALKEILAAEFRKAMKAANVSVSLLGKRMKTSRSSVHRFLDPKQKGMTLESLGRAADALNQRLSIRLEPRTKAVVKRAKAKSQPKHR